MGGVCFRLASKSDMDEPSFRMLQGSPVGLNTNICGSIELEPPKTAREGMILQRIGEFLRTGSAGCCGREPPQFVIGKPSSGITDVSNFHNPLSHGGHFGIVDMFWPNDVHFFKRYPFRFAWPNVLQSILVAIHRSAGLGLRT